MSEPFISYSINHEDALLHRVFGAQPVGFYVDVGAAHPTVDNDTKILYDRGWSGINIEPNPEYFTPLAAERARDRNFNVAIAENEGELSFFEVPHTGLSTCDAEEAARARQQGFEVVERRVPARTLHSVLEEVAPPAIDILKIDVEGFELQVLHSNDWSRFRPKLILAEATFPNTPQRRPDMLGPFLADQGYRHVYFDGLNDYFCEQGFTPPETAFATPLNVFDYILPYGRLQEREALRARASELLREHGAASAHAAKLTAECGLLQQQRQELHRANAELQARIAALEAELAQANQPSLAAEEGISGG